MEFTEQLATFDVEVQATPPVHPDNLLMKVLVLSPVSQHVTHWTESMPVGSRFSSLVMES